MMTKVRLGLLVLLLLNLLMNESLLAAQTSSASSLGRQGEDVDYSANEKMEAEEQFVAEKQGNSLKENNKKMEAEEQLVAEKQGDAPKENNKKMEEEEQLVAEKQGDAPKENKKKMEDKEQFVAEKQGDAQKENKKKMEDEEQFVAEKQGDAQKENKKKMEDKEQFVAAKQGNVSERNIGYRGDETSALVVTWQSHHSTKFTKSLNNNLSRKRRAQNTCYLPDGQIMTPGSSLTTRKTNTCLQVRANRPFKLKVDVSINWGADQTLATSSESLGITTVGDIWSSISIKHSFYKNVFWYWKLELTHGDKVIEESWENFWDGRFNSMTVTVWDCIEWCTEDRRDVCEIPSTTTKTPIKTTITPSTNPTTTLTRREEYSTTMAPASAAGRGEGDVPGTSSDDDSHCWLLVLPPLVTGVVAAAVLAWLRKRMNPAVALAIAAAKQPTVQQESTNPLYESSDVQLNLTSSTAMWNPARNIPVITFQEEGIYEN